MVNANDVKSTRSGLLDQCGLGRTAKLGWLEHCSSEKGTQDSVSK